MSAAPIHEPDPDDPVEILRVLPKQYHDQFLAEYTVAVDNARHPMHYRALHELLRLWRLRAVAYADPGYEDRLATVRDGRTQEFLPAEEVVPDWPLR